tara:strand:- start:144 stop:539 length:396 start_codon:yes stop_codon:yes gene_type:complete
MITITAPLFIDMHRKTMKDKRYYINLNVYRNLHHLVNSQLKKAYLDAVRDQLQGLSIETPVEITYKVYKPTKRTLDKMNVVSITSKFLLDAITELGCWVDDNDDYVKTETILPTEYDKNKGRVEITISTVD